MLQGLEYRLWGMTEWNVGLFAMVLEDYTEQDPQSVGWSVLSFGKSC